MFASLATAIFDGCTQIDAVTGITIVISRMTRLLPTRPLNIQRRQHSRNASSKVFFIPRPRKSNRQSTIGYKHTRHRHTQWQILSCVATPFTVKATSLPLNVGEDVLFDTDAFPIAIDTGSTFCLTDRRSDFRGALTKVDVRIQGISDKKRLAKWKGTATWAIQDDDGKSHTLQIPNTLLVEAPLPFRILSPQHFSQENAKSSLDSTPQGTCLIMGGTNAQLKWADQRYTKTVAISPTANIPIMHSAPGYKRFKNFTAITEPDTLPPLYCVDAHIIPDDESFAPDEDDDDADANNHPMSATTNTGSRHLSVHNRQQNTPEGEAGNTHNKNEGGQNGTAPPTTINTFEDVQHAPPTVEDFEKEESKLDNPAHELLLWHYKLGHEPFKNLQWMAQQGLIPKRLAKCRVPKCAACYYGKATRRPWREKGSANKHRIAAATAAGQIVSVDQMKSTVPGFIGQIKGCLTRQRYHFATVFVDQFSGLGYVHLQKTDSGEETLEAKQAFEGYSRSMNVRIQHYHADNGRFAENLFMNHVKKMKQTISFCGVNAHFQNGVAERRIRELSDGARTSLLHAKDRWPKAISVHLWPFAVRHRNEVFNATRRVNGPASPIEIFSNATVHPRLKHFHPFGCPTYRLNRALQGEKSQPRWEQRAQPVIYLGTSPRHASSVALALDLTTAHVSPQFHLKFDDLFETVAKGKVNPKAHQSNWQQMCHFTKATAETSDDGQPIFQPHVLPPPVDADIPTDLPAHIPEEQDDENSEPQGIGQSETEGPTADADAQPGPADAGNTGQRRSGRIRHATQKYQESLQQRADGIVLYFTSHETIDPRQYQEEQLLNQFETDPIAFKATADPDTMYLHEAMKEPDAQQFKEAMIKEVNEHTENGHWEVVPRSTVPEGVKVLPAVWSMKRKRRISTREIYKYKARLNIGGHKQEHGVHYWETYSPVVRWTTIRLMLILSLVFGWSTRQIDFVMAYPQANISTGNVYIDIPKGFQFEGSSRSHCLHVVKNIYGGKDAGRTWNQHLVKGMKELGFQQSDVDECVFYRDTTVFFVYVDDGVFLDADPANIDRAMLDLQSKFRVQDEGSLSDYLGVNVKQHKDGAFEFKQPQLIDSILEDLRLLTPGDNKAKPAETPAKLDHRMNKDPGGRAFDYTWAYRSVIGKMNFLEKSTRGDLAYSVHQCARFMSCPMRVHGEAVKRIGRYLLGSRNKGYFIRPNKEKSFEVYVDADYCGNWDPLMTDDADTAKSRSGYVIMYHGCPLVWASRLQTVFALSTAEAEYIALSTALREVIPMMELLKELKGRGLPLLDIPSIHCKVFEDNSGAREQAQVVKYRPRTRHINSAWHHFRSYVVAGLIKILPIRTDWQLGDPFTKQVSKDDFVRFRKLIFGW